MTIPLIRAGALSPMLRWMSERGRPVDRLLSDANLTYAMFVDQNEAIPVRDVARFLRNAAEAEGPDIGCRFISESDIRELALVGKIVLGAHSPREAFERVSRLMPWHSSHEVLTLESRSSAVVVGEVWLTRFDDLTLHLIHQYFSAVIRKICAMTGAPEPLLRRVEMTPHPDFGVTHLEKWFATPPVRSGDRGLRIAIDRTVAERSFINTGRDRDLEGPLRETEPLAGDGTLSTSARHVLALQLRVGKPDLDRLARSAGLTRRTLQRRLAEEATSFSELVETVRKPMALASLGTDDLSVREVSRALGYAHQSTLTRAIRRWTGRTPEKIRRATKV